MPVLAPTGQCRGGPVPARSFRHRAVPTPQPTSLHARTVSTQRAQHLDESEPEPRAGAPRWYAERSQARRALRAMTDAQLVEWLARCHAKSDRAGLASGAVRAWKGLLTEATLESK